MPRTRAEIQADLDRLQAELESADEEVTETVDEIVEVLEEAEEVHDEVTEEAADEIVTEIVDEIEEAAETVAEESPVTDSEETAEDEVAAKVVTILAERYNLHPVSQTPDVVVVTDEAAVETVAPVSEHWKNRKVF